MRENNNDNRRRRRSSSKKDKSEYLIPFYSERNAFEIPNTIILKNNADLKYVEHSIRAINLDISNTSNIPCSFIIKKILVIFFGLILFLITLYVSFFFSVLFLFNPMIIIFIIIFVISGEMNWLVNLYFNIKVKSKLAKMKNKIDDLNRKSKEISSGKYVWNLGRDYSWVTITINKKKSHR